MNKATELALRKQRLQFESAALRGELVRDFAGLEPAARAARRVQDGLTWLRAHPAVPVGVGVALLVARPSWVLRWAQRGYLAFRAWRALKARFDH